MVLTYRIVVVNRQLEFRSIIASWEREKGKKILDNGSSRKVKIKIKKAAFLNFLNTHPYTF